MSTRVTLLVVALAAFALGFAVARLAPVRQPGAADADLESVVVGDTVQLTAKPGDKYLIFETPPKGGPSTTAVAPIWFGEGTVTVNAPANVHRIDAIYHCPAGGKCNRCDDCPPVPPKPPYARGWTWLKIQP